MFGKLDRYLARNFIEPFLVAAAAITGLYVVADAFHDADEYLREAGNVVEALSRMAQTYGLRLPAFLAPVMPLAMLIGAAYGAGQLSSHNEINAMRACGLSSWRILGPIYAAASLTALLAFANRELVVPKVEQMAIPNRQVWVGKGERYERVVDYIDREGAQFTLMYNVAQRRARHLFVLRRLPDGKAAHFEAREAEPISSGWRLTDVRGEAAAVPGNIWRTSLRPRDLEARLLPLDVRPIPILRHSIRNAESEVERRLYRLHYASRLTYPFTGIVLIALGVPFVIAHERIQRSRMLGIGVCILICMLFYTVQYIAADLGQTGRLPPEVAAWLPIVIFGALGLYLLESLHG